MLTNDGWQGVDDIGSEHAALTEALAGVLTRQTVQMCGEAGGFESGHALSDEARDHAREHIARAGFAEAAVAGLIDVEPCVAEIRAGLDDDGPGAFEQDDLSGDLGGLSGDGDAFLIGVVSVWMGRIELVEVCCGDVACAKEIAEAFHFAWVRREDGGGAKGVRPGPQEREQVQCVRVDDDRTIGSEKFHESLACARRSSHAGTDDDCVCLLDGCGERSAGAEVFWTIAECESCQFGTDRETMSEHEFG